MKTEKHLVQIYLLATLLLATSVQAQYTFGPEVQKTPSANITYDSGTGLFQYTDPANSSDDQAYLPLIGTAANDITTSNGWTVSLAVNISARSTTATSGETPHVAMTLAVLYPNGGSTARIALGSGQINNTGGASGESSPNGFYGAVVQFAAVASGGTNAATPLGGSTYFPDGNLLVLSGGTNESAATESLGAASGLLTLSYDATTKIVTGYFNGTPVGSYSPDSWSNNPTLTLVVDGISGEGADVPASTATASDFSVSPSASVPFQWARRVASTADWPEGEPNTGLALDPHDNCYATGFFDGTNDFGGIILTNQSVGGSDIFVAKYNSAGALQWVQQAGENAGNLNYGRAIGVDTNGNIYVTGGYQGPATFGSINLAATSGEEFFLAKYNNAGAVQWVKTSAGGSTDNYGIGLTVDGAGNSYALAVMDYSGSSITFGTKTVTTIKGGHTLTILVKYDNTGTAQWAQLFDSTEETYATKLAVDAAGNVYVRGSFDSDITIGGTTLTASAGSTGNIFIAKFDNSGALTWIQQPQGESSAGEGGVAVDAAGNVYVSGAFSTNLNFGSGIILTNVANGSALFGDAFLAKYNGSGVIQWAQPAGGAEGGFFWDLALDAQTNVYVAGFLGSIATVAKYTSAGKLQWTESAGGPPASPVSSSMFGCAVDSTGNCYLDGFYQGTATFGATTLQPQEAWNFFLTEVGQSITDASATIQTSGASFGVRTNRFGFNITGASDLVVVVEASTNLINPVWIPISTNTLTGGTSYFSDPQWTNYPGRFYRISAP